MGFTGVNGPSTGKNSSGLGPDISQAVTDAILAAIGLSGKAKDTSNSTTSSQLQQLTALSAKTLLEQVAKGAQFQGTFSSSDINSFVNEFNKQARAELDKTVQQVTSHLTPASKAGDISKTIQSVLSTNSPSFLDPTTFAKDFIWSQWGTPGGTKLFAGALNVINQVRQLAKGWGNTAVSESEIQSYALGVARGTTSLADVNASMRTKGAPQYPQFADQIARVTATNPNATMYDIASPYINQMAKTLEMDPNSITLDNQLLDKALRPDGTAGKLPAMSLADFSRSLMNTPQWEQTTTANGFGRDAATGLAKAMGMGL